MLGLCGVGHGQGGPTGKAVRGSGISGNYGLAESGEESDDQGLHLQARTCHQRGWAWVSATTEADTSSARAAALEFFAGRGFPNGSGHSGGATDASGPRAGGLRRSAAVADRAPLAQEKAVTAEERGQTASGEAKAATAAATAAKAEADDQAVGTNGSVRLRRAAAVTYVLGFWGQSLAHNGKADVTAVVGILV